MPALTICSKEASSLQEEEEKEEKEVDDINADTDYAEVDYVDFEDAGTEIERAGEGEKERERVERECLRKI